ncbi:MAG: GNAT family N-acetyltransferase [Paludibacteraceae bacterium]|nr:GNAT family N-acetyltransferase [Paludibacteraceae bacterium]
MTSKERYCEWAQTQADMPIFMQPWWLDAVCAGKEWEEILPCMPCLVRKKWWMRWITMPQQTQIGGMWIDANTCTIEQVREKARQIDAKLREMKLDYYYQQYPIGSPLPAELKQLGYKVKERVTYQLQDLSDLDKVIDGFSRNKKRQLQKALSLHADRDLSAEDFYRFHTECLQQQHKVINYSREFFLVLDRKAQREQKAQIMAIRNADNQLLAAGYVVWDEKAMHYLIAAQNAEFKDSGAMSLLVLECIKLAREKGVVFDFEGSMMPGVALHFKQFGAVPVTYYSVEKYFSWWFAVPYFLYKLFTFRKR